MYIGQGSIGNTSLVISIRRIGKLEALSEKLHGVRVILHCKIYLPRINEHAVKGYRQAAVTPRLIALCVVGQRFFIVPVELIDLAYFLVCIGDGGAMVDFPGTLKAFCKQRQCKRIVAQFLVYAADINKHTGNALLVSVSFADIQNLLVV